MMMMMMMMMMMTTTPWLKLGAFSTMFVGNADSIGNKALLILPCVGFGSTPQLATDIIISALHLTRAGCLDSPYVHAIAGMASNDTKAEIVTSLDGMCGLV
jgi:uncharacterized metal-binding protein